MATSSTDTNTFTGGCHCRAITYSITLPVDQRKVATRCNCTFCQVPNYLVFRLPRKDCIKLLTPASLDDEVVGDYRAPKTSPDVHRYFCRRCGTHVYRDVYYKVNENFTADFVTVNLSTLDQPQEGLELSEWKYEYVDGRTGNFAAGPKPEPWKSGLI